MPGLDGLDLARVLARFSQPTAVVFVTAYDRHAIDAFDLRATDYVMKPVRASGCARRSAGSSRPPPAAPPTPSGPRRDDRRRARRGDALRAALEVRFVEAHGDYAGCTPPRSHLVRIPLTTLEERWAAAGFVRIHRSTSSRCPMYEIRIDGGRCAVRLRR